jgi:hypothetical protein
MKKLTFVFPKRKSPIYALAFILDGWKNAIEYCGWKFVEWDGTEPDRTFDELEPDIYVALAEEGYMYEIPKRVRKNKTLVCVNVPYYFDKQDFPDVPKDQPSSPKREIVEWVKGLKPQFVWNSVSPEACSKLLKNWREKEGFQVHSLMWAADHLGYRPANPREVVKLIAHNPQLVALSSDLGFVGCFANRVEKLKKYVYGFADKTRGKYTISLYGWGQISYHPYVNFYGLIPPNLIPIYAMTTTVIPCLSSDSYYAGGVCTERLFKFPLLNGFSICDAPSIYSEKIFREDEMLAFGEDRLSEYYDAVEYFIKNPEKRDSYIFKARSRVLKEHTYLHRLKQLLELLGLNDHAKFVQEKIAEFHKNWQTL